MGESLHQTATNQDEHSRSPEEARGPAWCSRRLPGEEGAEGCVGVCQKAKEWLWCAGAARGSPGPHSETLPQDSSTGVGGGGSAGKTLLQRKPKRAVGVPSAKALGLGTKKAHLRSPPVLTGGGGLVRLLGLREASTLRNYSSPVPGSNPDPATGLLCPCLHSPGTGSPSGEDEARWSLPAARPAGHFSSAHPGMAALVSLLAPQGGAEREQRLNLVR